MESSLTPEQRARIEQNRKLALEKRAARLSQIATNRPTGSPCSSLTISNQNTSHPQVSKSTSNTQNAANTCTSTKTFYHNQNNKSTASYTPLSITKTGTSDFGDKPKNECISKPNPHVTGTFQVVKDPVSGVSRLISKDRFTIDMLFHQQTVDILRTIKGKEYDSKTRLWTFPISEYFSLKKAVSVLRPHVIIGELPKCVVETFITKKNEYQKDASKVDISRICARLQQTLYPFQKDGVQFGVSKNGRCLIADEMGLGKSIQALGIADYYRSDWPLLIVCPSSMRFQWEEELRIQLPDSVHMHQVFVMTTGKDMVDGAQVLILSYDLLAKKKDMVKSMAFGVIILDESHCIKSSKTQRGKAALEVAEQCKRVILLSGTPALSRPAELYTQIQAVDRKAFPYFKEYGMRYCDGHQNHFGWDFSGSSNMEELGLLLEARFMIRRLKTKVLTQLPSKVRQVIVLKGQSLSKHNESMDAFAKRLQSSSLKGKERHGCLLSYFAETAKNKSAAVCEYIMDLLQDGKKFLCFAHHADMLDAVCEAVEKSKTYYIRIDGSTSAEDRKVLCDKFQYEEKWQVAVLSIKAANTGLTLTSAQQVVFTELFWNPGDLVQAEDRAHRIGQEDCVIVKYLIAKGTADDYLWPLIQNKLDILKKAGLSNDTYVGADTKALEIQSKNRETQTKIDDFFNDDDDEELLKVMDEIDGVQEKRMRLE